MITVLGVWRKTRREGEAALGQKAMMCSTHTQVPTCPRAVWLLSLLCGPPIPVGRTFSTQVYVKWYISQRKLNTGLEGVGRRHPSCGLGRPLPEDDICTDCGMKEWVSHANSLAKSSPSREFKPLKATAFSVGFKNSKETSEKGQGSGNSHFIREKWEASEGFQEDESHDLIVMHCFTVGMGL